MYVRIENEVLIIDLSGIGKRVDKSQFVHGIDNRFYSFDGDKITPKTEEEVNAIKATVDDTEDLIETEIKTHARKEAIKRLKTTGKIDADFTDVKKI